MSFSRRSGVAGRLDRGRIATAVAAASPPATVEHDLRNLGLGSDLWAYYDLRPTVSGATASITLATTLDGNGTTPPTVTISGSLATPRQVVITYDTGGAIGTMEYRMVVDGETLFNAVSSDTGGGNCTVDIGGGNSIVFNAGTYNVDNTHWVQCTAVAELTGLANATLDNALSGVGFRYEAHGLNGTTPCLRAIKNPSALSNTTGVPALVTGVDTDFEIHLLFEQAKHISGTGAGVVWGFSQSAAGHTTKSYLRKVATGPTNTSASRWLIRRRDSSGAPANVDVQSDGTTYADLDPHVMTDVITASGQMHHNGVPGRAAGASTLHRGVSTDLNRFSLGNINLSTAGFSTANQCLGRYSAMALTAPLSDANRMKIWKALAGIAQ